jgi:TolA-binding protein
MINENKTPEGQLLPLQKITETVEKTISKKLNELKSLEEKIDKLNHSIEYVDSPFKEVKDLKKKVEDLQKENDYLHEQNKKLEIINIETNTKLYNLIESDELRKTKEAYNSLLVFAFTNINPVTDFDPAHAKHYWENLVK